MTSKGGRPRLDRPTGRKATIYLMPDIEAKAKVIGAGNLSAGLAVAVRKYRHTDSGTVRKEK